MDFYRGVWFRGDWVQTLGIGDSLVGRWSMVTENIVFDMVYSLCWFCSGLRRGDDK